MHYKVKHRCFQLHKSGREWYGLTEAADFQEVRYRVVKLQGLKELQVLVQNSFLLLRLLGCGEYVDSHGKCQHLWCLHLREVQPRCYTSSAFMLLCHVLPGVLIVVVLACVGFIVVLVALGVRRIRNAGRHSRHRRAVAAATADMSGVSDDRQEMEWDNSALTITVNPMDQQVRQIYTSTA